MTKTIRLVAEEHLSYVPHHVAAHLGLFERYGLNIEINYDSGPGGSWLADMLADGRADIARGGVWIPLMYRGRLEEIRIFSELCSRNTQVLIGRDAQPNFSWSNLYGKSVLLPASSTSQWMYFKGVLVEAGIDIEKIRWIRDLDESTTTRLWRGGFCDYYLTYSPLAEELLEDGYHFATDFSLSTGAVPWSVYYTSPGYLAENRGALVAFNRALSEAVAWMDEKGAAATAELIASDFADTGAAHLTAAIRRMHDNGTWTTDMSVIPEPFMRYQGMISDYGLTDAPVPYADIIDNAV